MSRLASVIFHSFIISVLLISPALADGVVVGKSTGLYGCSVTSLAQSSDGAIQFVTCPSTPKGIYYTKDFGSTWTFASGGEYALGVAQDVVVNSQAVFFYSATSGTIYRAELPLAAEDVAAWTPSWSILKNSPIPSSGVSGIAVSGNRLIVMGTGAQVRIFNASNGTLVQSKDVTTDISGSYLTRSLAVGAAGYVYTVVYSSYSGTGKLYRAQFNGSEISSDWVEVNLPTIQGSDVPMPTSVLASPDNKVYVLSTRSRDYNYVWSSYVSTNNGESFSRLGSTYDNPQVFDPYGTEGCFSADGGMHIIGSNLSLNAGSTWSYNVLASGYTGADSAEIKFKKNGCLFHPTDTNKVLMVSIRGLARTTNFLDGQVVWSDADSGLEGVYVEEMAQSYSDKDKVVVNTSSGMASTANFTAESPSWDFTCLGGTYCENIKRVAADPVDSSKFYAWTYVGHKLYTGTFGASGLSWSELADPGIYLYANALRTSSALPGKLLAAYGSVSSGTVIGGVFFYNTADGNIIKTPLSSKSVLDVIAINENVLYAAVGHSLDTNNDSIRGIYKSTDGGDSFNLIDDSDVPSNVLFGKFAYDSSNDVLYLSAAVAGSALPKDVYYAENASSESANWSKAVALPSSSSPNSILDLTTDSNGTLYVATFSSVMKSSDKGSTWSIHYSGISGEEVRTVFWDDLLMGSNRGLVSLVQATPTPTATPTVVPTTAPTSTPTATPTPSARCSISVANYKSGKAIKLPRSFVFNVNYNGTQRRGGLESRSSSSSNWRSMATLSFSKGKARVGRIVKKTQQFRAVMRDCTTKTFTVKGR